MNRNNVDAEKYHAARARESLIAARSLIEQAICARDREAMEMGVPNCEELNEIHMEELRQYEELKEQIHTIKNALEKLANIGITNRANCHRVPFKERN